MFRILYNRLAHLERLVTEKEEEVARRKHEFAEHRSELAQELSAEIDAIEDPQMRYAVRRVFVNSFGHEPSSNPNKFGFTRKRRGPDL